MKILIWGEIKNSGPYDIFRQLDYQSVYQELLDNYHANCFNVGNKVWIQGLVSELSTPENELYFLNPKETWDEINSKYDKIVYSAANMLASQYIDLIEDVSKLFRNSKIPVYIIAIGAQADAYDDIDSLVKDTKHSVAKLIDSVYATGGEIACRGFFTKEYLNRVASNTAVVTGCPSLFQNGRKLKIALRDEKIKTVLNGNAPIKDLLEDNNSIYVDQDTFLGFMYDLTNYDMRKYLSYMIYHFGKDISRYFFNGKIKIFWDIPEWRKFIRDNHFNFSAGSRIHGSIMSILSGIPAVIYPSDSRVREMAEFYHIPLMQSFDDYYMLDQVRQKVDYAEFNKEYPKLFDEYEKFLQDCGLVKSVNQDNIFWNRELPINRDCVYGKIEKMRTRIESFNAIDQMYLKLAPVQEKLGGFDEYKLRALFEKY